MSLREPSSSASSFRSISPQPYSNLRGNRSFTRLESSDGKDDPLTASLSRLKSESPAEELEEAAAVPEPNHDSENDEDDDGARSLLPEGFDELPPELITLADRFIESLTKPIHPTPVSITDISEFFQQFYVTASHAIGNHVSKSYLSLASKKAPKKIPTQMLSRAEISQKKRDRKLLEVRRIALEEAIEKRVTEGLYERLWRHKSTDDEARDDSLHSKIAALKVVGVNLGHLGVELDSEEKREIMDRDLQAAVLALQKMNDERHPLGKLTSLKQAHKIIVDCLTTNLEATSADSLLPALIYTLIISPPEPALNAVSNLLFISRFRTSNFVDGEAAYCLTNFEAALSFLETVDLATLNISDTDGPAVSPLAPPQPLPYDPLGNLTEKLTKASTSTTATEAPAVYGGHASASSSAVSLQPAAALGRKLNYLTPIDLATTAATTAVSTADQGIRGIGYALEGSYKFLFNRQGDNVPKTLEDARKLVEKPNPAEIALQREDSSDSMPILPTHDKPLPKDRPAAPSPSLPIAAGLDPLKTLGSSIGRFANIGMRGFSRSAAASPATVNQQPAASPTTAPHSHGDSAGVKDLLSTFPGLTKELGDEKLKVENRFLEVRDAGELKIAEVTLLLEEYRKLVRELKKRGLA